MKFLLIVLCGGAGSLARYVAGTAVTARYGSRFPWGTLVVNVTGSFLIGLFAGMFRSGASTTARAFLMTGICGGYTTFSSFSLQNLQLLENGNYYYAGVNTALSLLLCMLGVWLGYIFGNMVSAK